LPEQIKKYSCRYCGLEFYSEEECKLHESKQCNLNPNLFTNESSFKFILLVAGFTLTVVGLAVIVFSPALLYLFLLSNFRPQYDYVALAIFWIVIFVAPIILGAAVDYIRKNRENRK
jgi:uncharacterized membrane protein